MENTHIKSYIEDVGPFKKVEQALRVIGWYVRENTRSKRREWSRDRGKTWEATTDAIESTVWSLIQDYCELKPKISWKNNKPKPYANVEK